MRTETENKKNFDLPFIKRNISRLMNAVFILLFFYLLCRPIVATAPVVTGIFFCIRVIVPSLYIYVILSRIIITLPLVYRLRQKLGRYGTEIIVFFTGTLCGFPVGAKSAVLLYERGEISKKRAEYICAFSNNASMSFLLGFVGVQLFGDIMTGVRLCLFQAVSSVISALMLRMLFMKKDDFSPIPQTAPPKRERFTNAVLDGTKSMVAICAYIVVFMVFSEAALSIIPLEGLPRLLMRGLIEFSSGISSSFTEMASGIISSQTAFVLCGLFCGFSGICVITQVVSSMKGRLSPKMYVLGRLLCTCFTTLLALIFPL